MSRRGVLFLSPIMPDETGNGLAMRAGVSLAALAARFDVHLGVVPVAGGDPRPSPLVERCAASLQTLSLDAHLDPHFGLLERVMDPEARRRARLTYPKPFLCRFCTSRSAAAVAAWREGRDIAAIHVMRAYLAPFADACGSGGDRPFRVLDLDEDEISVRSGIAALHRSRGETELADAEEHEAATYRALMPRILPAFDRVLVSSATEAQRVRALRPETVTAIVPNAAPRFTTTARPAQRPEGPGRLLMVGNLGYLPNEDGVRYLCEAILPELRAAIGKPLRVTVAGGGAAPDLLALGAANGLDMPGRVDDLAPLYAGSDIAVVPLRAGGGTRIKILEAFAAGVPVVATPIGAEGIEATLGEHLMIGSTPSELANACSALLDDPARASTMAARASDLVRRAYRADLVEAGLLAVYDPVR